MPFCWAISKNVLYIPLLWKVLFPLVAKYSNVAVFVIGVQEILLELGAERIIGQPDGEQLVGEKDLMASEEQENRTSSKGMYPERNALRRHGISISFALQPQLLLFTSFSLLRLRWGRTKPVCLFFSYLCMWPFLVICHLSSELCGIAGQNSMEVTAVAFFIHAKIQRIMHLGQKNEIF